MDIVDKYAGPDLLKHYSDGGYLSLFAALALLPEAVMAGSPRALVIGGGAGEMATTLTTYFKTLEVDVLEPDATVIRMARRHFGFDASVWRDGARVHAGSARYERVRVLETDAMRWLRRVPTSSEALRYDYVVLDAYVTKERSVTDMPDTFAHEEFCAALAAALRPHGVVTAQLFRSDQNGAAFRRHCDRTFERSFLLGHHKLPREAQWWSLGQRVIVLAGSGGAAGAGGAGVDAVAAHAPCTNATTELDGFAAAASRLTDRSQLPFDMGRLVRARHYEFGRGGRRCPYVH